MEMFLAPLNWFSQNILQNPAFFVGLLVLIGYLLLKKPIYEVFAGFVKATVGYLILNVGAGGLVTTFRPILVALAKKFELKAAVIDPYFGLAAANTKLEEMGFISVATTALLIGFGVNILLVALRKVTKVRTLFITGHIMVQQAATISVFVLLLIPQFQNAFGAWAVGIICGLYWAVSSNMTVEATQRLTGGGGFAIGHQQQFAIWFVDKVAPIFGKKEENLDNLKLPTFLNIFHDTVVASATLMLVFFGAILAVLGPDIMSNVELIGPGAFNPAKQAFFMYILQTSLTFSVYLFILMQGVRMFVSELTNAFQGISSKLLPGSFPAVDVA
ncbi:PTS ascorbate transporter subunit IIC, partial [Streptococcus dysgalactiae]